jgi:LysR family transcriptional regulator, transcriptional activator of the cysJI operon
MASLENFRLVVFRAVAEQLSFRKAAEELYLTQPAVSLQIKALEQDLGVQLFDRAGSRITLTAAGQMLLGYAREVSVRLHQAEQALTALAGSQGGHLSLGASTTIAQYVLPRLIADFCREHPRIRPTMISGNTEQIVRALTDQKIALGFIEGPARSRDVKTESFLIDEIVLIVPAAHEWAERAAVPSSELASIPLLLRERGSGTRRVVEAALEKCHLKRGSVTIAMELDSTEAIKSAVESGMGAGFVSRWALAKDQRVGNSLRVIELEGVRIRRDLLIAYPAGPGPQGLAQQFERFVLSRVGTSSMTARSLR